MATVYAQASDFSARFPDVSAKVTTKGLAVSTFLADASATADGYLQSHYALPLTAWEADLTGKVCEIAAYKAMIAVGFKPGPGSQDANWERIYDGAIQWLQGVGEGRIPIVVTDSPSGGQEEGPLLLTDQSRQIEDPYMSGQGTYTTLLGPILGPG